MDGPIHGLRTPNEGINQRYLKNWADVADKICCRHTLLKHTGRLIKIRTSMFIELDANLWRAYHNQLPFKMTITTYSYATNDLLPPFGRVYIHQFPNAPIT